MLPELLLLANLVLFIVVLRRLESLRSSVTSIRRKIGDLEPLPDGFIDCWPEDGRQKSAEKYLREQRRAQ